MDNSPRVFRFATLTGRLVSFQAKPPQPLHEVGQTKPPPNATAFAEIFDDKRFVEGLLGAIDSTIVDKSEPRLSPHQTIGTRASNMTSTTGFLVVVCSFPEQEEKVPDSWNVTIHDIRPGEPFHPEWRQAS